MKGEPVARWSRGFPDTPAVEGPAFQDEGEPFPGHWKEFPEAWPSGVAGDPAVSEPLAEALAELPETWRAVVVERDVQHRDAAEVAAEHGVTVEQQRAILNRARAFLRERLNRYLSGGAER